MTQIVLEGMLLKVAFMRRRPRIHKSGFKVYEDMWTMFLALRLFLIKPDFPHAAGHVTWAAVLV